MDLVRQLFPGQIVDIHTQEPADKNPTSNDTVYSLVLRATTFAPKKGTRLSSTKRPIALG
jgi:hypothetical protein